MILNINNETIKNPTYLRKELQSLISNPNLVDEIPDKIKNKGIRFFLEIFRNRIPFYIEKDIIDVNSEFAKKLLVINPRF